MLSIEKGRRLNLLDGDLDSHLMVPRIVWICLRKDLNALVCVQMADVDSPNGGSAEPASGMHLEMRSTRTVRRV